MVLPIFLAEDDPAIRDQLMDVIDHACAAKVVATADTQAGATAWMNAHPDDWALAVIDLYLREGTGFGILETLDPAARRDQVVVLTNSATLENKARCMALGARAAFDKTAELGLFLDHCRAQRAARG